MQTFGHPAKDWQAAKDQIRDVLIDCAKREATITYSELVAKVSALDLQAHDPRLDQLLGQIASEEVGAGRGMLSVVVVHKTGDLRPGKGFYTCAEQLRMDVSDPEKLWVDQLKRVYSSWRQT